ncbi:MAG: M15 family metallopeptidase [Candidatus Sulfotelmatobacter sp.]
MGNFYTDVISRDTRFRLATRVCDASLLEPATRQLVAAIVSAASRMGIELMIYETYRSQERQQELFDQGATKLRTVGVHHYGLACDLVRVVAGEPSWKGDFSFLGRLAQSSRMIWGGDWGAPHIRHSFIDSVHVQRCTVARESELFEGMWFPDESYNPYEDHRNLLASVINPPIKVATVAESGPDTQRT